jgi:hypothetical protein
VTSTVKVQEVYGAVRWWVDASEEGAEGKTPIAP